MTQRRTNPKVDAYLSKAEKWREELAKLRTIILDCGLTEELKWGKPCYAFQTGNIVIMLPLKAHCALLFFKGSLLKDPSGILTKAGENSEAGRQLRFTDVREITKMEPVLKAYLREAMEVEKAGLTVKTKKVSELKIPEELQNKLDKVPAFKAAFVALTPGRQRGYIFYFSAPKQPKTRESRIEKCRQAILKGKGLYD